MPFCQTTLRGQKRKNPAYPQEVTTLGDHIRKTRLDRNLLQKDVAKEIGVDTFTILNWEKNLNEPQVQYLPKIMNFFGYCPYQKIQTLGEFLTIFRGYRLGLDRKKMAKQIGIDETTLWQIELDGRKRLFNNTRKMIGIFLVGHQSQLPQLRF